MACAARCLLIELGGLRLSNWSASLSATAARHSWQYCRLASEVESVATFGGEKIVDWYILRFFFGGFTFAVLLMGNCCEDQRPDESDKVGEQDSVIEWN
mmetsp:Transcript_7150/g.10609  ORF Transcript_7150/g.10609 Transcript_7150/m.10609 type:complete len:99 (-) Transcript_7150:384-680(-)